MGFQPLWFGMSKASFLAVEEKYGLPTEMLPFFKFNGGGHSYYFRHSASHDPEQLGKIKLSGHLYTDLT
jgi:hypothetical protein